MAAFEPKPPHELPDIGHWALW